MVKQDPDSMTQSFSDIKETFKVKTIETYLFHVNFEVNEVAQLLWRSVALVSLL